MNNNSYRFNKTGEINANGIAVGACTSDGLIVGDWENITKKNQLAYIDGETYTVMLSTAEEFGCVNFEEIEYL